MIVRMQSGQADRLPRHVAFHANNDNKSAWLI